MQVDTKLSQLRTEMVNAGVDAMIVANTDPHNNEYVAERWCGRQWLTGMKGSNGTAVVTANWCGLWTDSRYYEITEDAIAGTEIELMRMSDIGAITVDLPTPVFHLWSKRRIGSTTKRQGVAGGSVPL